MSAPASAPERGWKSEKVDEAQALARSCAARRPDFQPCDGLSICATHSHGKCFKLHWCCHLGWCHCKYVYQPMTPVEQLPSTEIPARPREPTNTIQISVSLTEHFLKFASVFQPPLPPDSPRYCMISDLFIDNYQVKCINGKMCYVQKQPAPHSHKTSPEEVSAHDALISRESSTPKIDHCSSPSSSEDSGINAVGAHYVESCDEDTEEGAELSSEEDYSPESSWEPDECTLLSPSQSDLEVLVLEDAAEGGAALGAAEGPVALAAATLGELCEESQLRGRDTDTRQAGPGGVGSGAAEKNLGRGPRCVSSKPVWTGLDCLTLQ
uniref:CC070 protein n=1 Tax=Oryctolagus cuniculus TaxID=9986 RepID=A0A5F9D1Q8_RABIT